ncbi:MAG: hypothetical protein Q8R60_02770 [Mycobacteriales bacterium]|nr:hypothetical protein [Mycobacteriales bacterium]
MRLTRRTLLLSGALPLAACTDAPAPQPAPVDPDIALRDAAAARERRLLQEYDAALAAVPSLAAVLAPLRADHVAHLTALSPTGTPSPGPPSPGQTSTPTPAGSSSGPLPAAALPTAAPARRAAVLARLVAAERAAATAHATDALAASTALTGLLGQLSACERSHPVVLV